MDIYTPATQSRQIGGNIAIKQRRPRELHNFLLIREHGHDFVLVIAKQIGFKFLDGFAILRHALALHHHMDWSLAKLWEH